MKWFFICSKDNPVRVFNQNGKILHNYLIKNDLDEIINPISIKLDNYALNLFCGLNKHFLKIDLVTDKISHKFDLKCFQENSLISCFDFNHKNDFFICGSYSGKIYLNDNKNCKPFHIIQNKHLSGVNNLKFLNNSDYFLSGGRKDNEILLWDCRNLKEPINSFYRNNDTHQKLNFVIDNLDKFLYVANVDGSVIIYDTLSSNVVSYFYVNENKETVSSLDLLQDFNVSNTTNSKNILVTSTGKRHFVFDTDESFDEMDSYQTSSFRFWNFNNLYTNLY